MMVRDQVARHPLVGACLLGAVLLLVSCRGRQPIRPSGTPAPLFELPDLNGRKVSLAAVCADAQVVVLDFWARWCGPCIDDMPRWEALSRRFSASEVKVISIEVGSDPAVVRRFVREIGVSFPVLLDTDKSVASRYNVSLLPRTIFLANGCRSVYEATGGLPTDAVEIVEDLLR